MARIDPSPRGCNPITKSGALILISVVPAKAGTQGFESLVPGSPLSRRAVRGKSCGDHRSEIAFPISSWPGSTRPSTPWAGRNKDVDTRIKSAQDELKCFLRIRHRSSLQENFPRIALHFREDSELADPQHSLTASEMTTDDSRYYSMEVFPLSAKLLCREPFFGD